MSNIDKQALRERYSQKPVPECHICGEEMTIQRISASRITYGCTGATYDDKGCHYAEGRSIADDHYEQSRVTVVDVSDPDVLALLDELEAAENNLIDSECHVAELEEALRDKQELLEALDNSLCELLPGTQYMDPPDGGSVTPLEQVRRMVADYLNRIAELESRTVTLPEPFKMAKSSSGLTYYYADEVDAAIQAAGIGVKGE